MSTTEALVWYVAVPAVVLVLIALAVYAPSWIRSPKYRPGLSWWAEPAWLGGGDLAEVERATPVDEGGGCSARW
ncbi:MAG: hypothetical protein OEV62_00865 [Actinomycetota bacterium]|nr:hypothetical protein [Actinomycetota bacterium]